MSDAFGELDAQEIQIAVGIAEDSNDLDDFVFNLQNRMLDMSQASYQQSADLAAQIMSDSLESNKLDLSKMFSDENFLTFLEEQNTTMEEMTAKSYEEQYQIISKFYSDVNTLAFATYQEQEALGYNRIAELQAEIANYNKFMQGPMGKNVESERERYAQQQEAVDNAKNEEDRVKAQKALDDMARKFQGTYGFSIESNIQDMENEIKSLMDSLDELQDKRIELAMDWSEVDKLQEGLEDAAALTQFIQNDTKKVGETYQLTTAQAQEWLKFYPELGKNAQSVGEGIIALDASVVDNFIQGKEDSMDASIETTKTELEAQKAVLESELAAKEAEFNAAKALAEGKMNLEDVSNKYLVDLRTNLTDYYAQCGFDEVEANRKALETMGLNEQEYSDLVAQSCTTNVKNIGDSADEGAQFQLKGIKKVWNKWTEFGSYIKNNIGQLLSDLGDAVLNPKEWKKIPGMVKDFVSPTLWRWSRTKA